MVKWIDEKMCMCKKHYIGIGVINEYEKNVKGIGKY